MLQLAHYYLKLWKSVPKKETSTSLFFHPFSSHWITSSLLVSHIYKCLVSLLVTDKQKILMLGKTGQEKGTTEDEMVG